jgi:hypothetical protein
MHPEKELIADASGQRRSRISRVFVVLVSAGSENATVDPSDVRDAAGIVEGTRVDSSRRCCPCAQRLALSPIRCAGIPCSKQWLFFFTSAARFQRL